MQRIRFQGLVVRLVAVLTSVTLVASVRATVLFDQMSNASSTIIPSSWIAPDGMDGDTYSWDNFRITKPAEVQEVWWIGGGGTISGVTIRFYEGLAAAPDYQPKITALPESETPADYLKGYRFNLASTNPVPLGGEKYQYHAILPTVLRLAGSTVYWIKIEGDGVNNNSWGVVQATHGRDAMHFRFMTGFIFQRITGSLGFQLKGRYLPPTFIGPRA